MHTIVLTTIALTALSAVTIANAGKPWNTPGQSKPQNDVQAEARIEVRFSNYDRELVRHYYGSEIRNSLPPGLAKKTNLPPGLQKQIVKNGKLPPGHQAKYLPNELEQRLDGLPKNYVRLRVGTDIVLMDIPTKIVLDVIKDTSF